MKKVIIFSTCLILLSFDYKNENRKEYYKVVSRLIAKIQALESCQIDTINNVWIAKTKEGFFYFEGEVNGKNDFNDYEIIIKSIIYDSCYFDKQFSIMLPYRIYRSDNRIDTYRLEINTATESIDDTLPFNMKDVEIAYKEKRIGLPFSEDIVFNRMSFDENYIVIFKDKTIKKYYVHSVSRKFIEGF